MRKLKRWVFAVVAGGAITSCAKAVCIDKYLGDGRCDKDFNNEECGYDAGDCCKCTCSSALYDCQHNSFACINPDVWCVDDDDVTASIAKCIVDFVGDAYCDLANNNEECGYDGGDCCECTCRSTSLVNCGSARDLGQSGFSCRDPNANCVSDIVTFVASSSTSSSSSSSMGEPVDVGTKTKVSAVATAHDTRGGSSSDDVGCGEAGKGGCEPYLTRDGDSTSVESRWSCTNSIVTGRGQCEIKFFFDDPQDIVDIKVAFWRGDPRTHTLKVICNGQRVHTHESYTGSTGTFHSLGVEANSVETVGLEPVDLPTDEWIHLLEVLIMVKP